MRLSRPAALLLSVSLLAACASRGDLRSDATALDPAALASTASLPPDAAAAWPAGDWWRGLGSAELDALVAEALADNPDLAAADARARAADAAAGLAEAERRPTLNASASVSGAHLPASVIPADAGGGHFGLSKYALASFKWGLDPWGGKRAAWQAALGAARASAIEARAARIALSVNVARGWVALGAAGEQDALARADLDAARQARDLIASRVAAGLDNRLALNTAEADLAAAERESAETARAVRAGRNALAALLGKGPDRGRDIALPALPAPAAFGVPDQLPLGLVAHRPDLVAARWRIDAAGQAIDAAEAAFLPDISLGAMAGFVSLGGGNPFTLPARFYQFGPSLSLPIFEGGRLRANLADKDARRDLAVAHWNQTLVGALREVADAVTSLDALAGQADAAARALASARENLGLARAREAAGIGNRLGVLAASHAETLAARSAQALAAERLARALDLVQALGGGFTPDAEGPATASTPPHS